MSRRKRALNGLDDDIHDHIARDTEDNLARGMSPEEARRQALLKFGNVRLTQEDTRSVWGRVWLEQGLQDVRFAVRLLRHSHVFTAVAILSLGLGIGANTTIFSLADAVLLRTLPVERPRDLVVLRQRGPSGDIWPFTSSAAADLATSGDVLSGVAAFRPTGNAHVTVNGDTELALTQSVSGNYHAVLGIRPVVGRTLTEDDRAPVAVISHRHWQRRFGGDLHVVGRAIEVQGRSFTVVGVTPPGFYGTQPGRHVDVTVPLNAQVVNMPPNARWLYLIGRLKTGVSRERAEVALATRWIQLRASAPGPPSSVSLHVDSGAQGLNELRRQFSVPLRILMATVGFVLLLACANLAGLLFARSTEREQEVALRLALGAGRWRLVRQLVTESALLAAAGGAAGLALAYWLTPLLLAMMSRGREPIALDVVPDGRTLLFTLAVTMATAVLFGLLPALGASRTGEGLRSRLGSSGANRPRHAWARAMVAAEVALLVVLLTGTGLFARTLHNLRAVDAGFRPEQVFVVRLSLGRAYPGASARVLYEDLYARFSALPGVHSVSTAMDTPPLGELSMGMGIAIPGRPADPDDAPQVYHNFVGPRFFETMNIPILAGRDFGLCDDPGAPRCVVISESVARRYFPGDDPLARQLTIGGAASSIVGVVKDVRYTTLRADAPLMVYRSYRQETNAPIGAFLIRTGFTTAEALTSLVRAEIRSIAPTLPSPSVTGLADEVAAVLVEERMLAALSMAVGILAAVLAAIGIYGAVASSVARRQREIGIRMALGAEPGGVARMVVTNALATVLGGLVLGVPAAIAVAIVARGALADVLFELSPTDPIALLSAATAILLIAAVAAYGPARRAARIDPLAAVKSE